MKKVLGTNVLVKIIRDSDEPLEKVGRLYLTDNSRGFTEAEVVLVPDDYKSVIQPKDQIYIRKGCPTILIEAKENLNIVDIKDILLVL